jgi:hypothetical protein
VAFVGSNAERQMTVQSRSSLLLAAAMRQLVIGLVLMAATVALYYPVSHHQFVNYDDDVYVTGNLHVKYGLDWNEVK